IQAPPAIAYFVGDDGYLVTEALEAFPVPAGRELTHEQRLDLVTLILLTGLSDVYPRNLLVPLGSPSSVIYAVDFARLEPDDWLKLLEKLYMLSTLRLGQEWDSSPDLWESGLSQLCPFLNVKSFEENEAVLEAAFERFEDPAALRDLVWRIGQRLRSANFPPAEVEQYLGHLQDNFEVMLKILLRIFNEGNILIRRYIQPDNEHSHFELLRYVDGKDFSVTLMGEEGESKTFTDPKLVREWISSTKDQGTGTRIQQPEKENVKAYSLGLGDGQSITLQLAGHFQQGYQSAEEWEALLEQALAREGRSLTDLAQLPDRTLTIILADTYTHLAGNCTKDGIVILDRKIFERPKKFFENNSAAAAVVSQILVLSSLAHELGAHELTGEGNEAHTPERHEKDLANLVAFAGKDYHLSVLGQFLSQPGLLVHPLGIEKLIKKKFLKSPFFNVLVISAFAVVFYYLGFMSLGFESGIWKWVEHYGEGMFNFVFFSILSDALTKRSLNKPISHDSIFGASKSGLISGLFAMTFIDLINLIPGIPGAILRPLLITVLLAWIRTKIMRIFIRTEDEKKEKGHQNKKEKTQEEKDKDNRQDEMYWQSRSWALIKNGIVQNLPYVMRGPIESAATQWFQQYFSSALHLQRPSLVSRPDWFKAIQGVFKHRGLSLIVYGFLEPLGVGVIYVLKGLNQIRYLVVSGFVRELINTLLKWGRQKLPALKSHIGAVLLRLDKRLPKGFFFNGIVITVFGVLFYSLGLMTVDNTDVLWKWVEYTLENVFTFTFFSVLSDILAKRSINEPLSRRAFWGAVASGAINGVVTIIFFALINFIPGPKGFTAFVRMILVMFALVPSRNRIYRLLFHVEGKEKKKGDIANREYEMFFMSRPFSFVKNSLIQGFLPLALRGGAESLVNQYFQQYFAWALNVDKPSLVNRPDWLGAIQRFVRYRWVALIIYTFIAFPHYCMSGWLLGNRVSKVQSQTSGRDKKSGMRKGNLFMCLYDFIEQERVSPNFSVTAREFQEHLEKFWPPQRRFSRSTIQNELRGLWQIGFLERERVGRSYRYTLPSWLKKAAHFLPAYEWEKKLNPDDPHALPRLKVLQIWRLRSPEQREALLQVVEQWKKALEFSEDTIPNDQDGLLSTLLRFDIKNEAYLNEVYGVYASNEYSEEMGADFRGYKGYAALYDLILYYLKRYASPLTGKRILEVGPGSGVFLLALRDFGVRVEGLEMNSELVTLARSQGLAVTEGNLRSPPETLLREPYDITFSHYVLDVPVIEAHEEELTPEVHTQGLQMLEQLARLTKMGGLSIHQTERGWPFKDEDVIHAGFEILDGGVSYGFMVLRRVAPKIVTEFSNALDEFERDFGEWEEASKNWDGPAARDYMDGWGKWVEDKQNRFFLPWGKGWVVPRSEIAGVLEPLMVRFLQLTERAASLFQQKDLDPSLTVGLAYIQAAHFYHFLWGDTNRALEYYAHAPETQRQAYLMMSFAAPLLQAWGARQLEVLNGIVRPISSNIACGTMTEESDRILGMQLESQFNLLRNIYNSGISQDLKSWIESQYPQAPLREVIPKGEALTEWEADVALFLKRDSGLSWEDDFETLQSLRSNIHELAEYQAVQKKLGRGIEFFFVSPETGTELFWDLSRGLEKATYAAGHLNTRRTRIFISLPIAVSYSEIPLEIARHDLIHALRDVHDPSLDEKMEGIADSDRRMLEVMRKDPGHGTSEEKHPVGSQEMPLREKAVSGSDASSPFVLAQGGVPSSGVDEPIRAIHALLKASDEVGFRTRKISLVDLKARLYLASNIQFVKGMERKASLPGLLPFYLEDLGERVPRFNDYLRALL
ncbi:MAG: hypothetical protein HYS08_10590, partial [Chlamydiae bacterium]|nr:hypothetical protein [Chlamydiota bacterium]MBI3265993.1 hypothetical protein [Chlamydiota bacterium]